MESSSTLCYSDSSLNGGAPVSTGGTDIWWACPGWSAWSW